MWLVVSHSSTPVLMRPRHLWALCQSYLTHYTCNMLITPLVLMYMDVFMFLDSKISLLLQPSQVCSSLCTWKHCMWASDRVAAESCSPIISGDLWKQGPPPVQIGTNDMKLLPINTHLFILHWRDPLLSGIKAQSARGVVSQEEITRVRERKREGKKERWRSREQWFSED